MGIDTQDDPRHERREQLVQRVGWVLMALFVAAAVAGLFGSGPLARAHAGAAGRVTYPRFARVEAPARFEIDVPAGRPARLWLDAEVIHEADLESMSPEPDHTTVEGHRVVYDFSGDGPAHVVFTLRHQSMGRKHLRLGLPGGEEVALTQVVFP